MSLPPDVIDLLERISRYTEIQGRLEVPTHDAERALKLLAKYPDEPKIDLFAGLNFPRSLQEIEEAATKAASRWEDALPMDANELKNISDEDYLKLHPINVDSRNRIKQLQQNLQEAQAELIRQASSQEGAI